jgi:DNA-binding MarR family transcriptional regulator
MICAVVMSVPGDTAQAIGVQLCGLFLQGLNQQRVLSACDEIELSPPALKALLSLQAGQAVPMRVLAGKWRCDASWVTALVDQLEERGYAERRVLPDDRRVRTVVITDLGLKGARQALAAIAEPPATLHNLTAKEQAQLHRLLAKLAPTGP